MLVKLVYMVTIFAILFYIGHKFLMPLVLKMYKGKTIREIEYETEFETIERLKDDE